LQLNLPGFQNLAGLPLKLTKLFHARSLRGTANLLDIDHAPLKRVVLNWPPKTLKPFIDKGLSVVPKSVEVVAKNSPHKGRPITVYDSSFIESFIRGYALALANDVLRQNQRHIGKRCVTLQSALTRSAIDIAIKQACGLSTDIQQTAQKNYIDAVKLIKEFGFTCSAGDDIAIKKDITQFLDIPESTLNRFVRPSMWPIRYVGGRCIDIRCIKQKLTLRRKSRGTVACF